MEQDKELEKILSELREMWNEWKDKPNDGIEKALKKAVKLNSVIDFSIPIEEYEKDSFKKSRLYKKWPPATIVKLGEEYNDKINQINMFLRSLFCTTLKKSPFLISDSTIAKIVPTLEKGNYFENSGEKMGYDVFKWVVPIYAYYLGQVGKETVIPYGPLSDRIRKELFQGKTIDQWSKFFPREDFVGLANWTKNFVQSTNTQMINESIANVKWLQERVNPKFYFLKTTENSSAVVFNEYGSVYVFVKGCKTPILCDSEKFKSEFMEIRRINPTAFPEFHPEEW